MPETKDLLAQLASVLAKTEQSELPRYKQLYEALRQQILTGLVLPGTRLPSSRVLAQQLGIARNTAMAAIEQLCAEGYAKARPGSGIYILATAPMTWDIGNQPPTIPAQLKLSSRGKRMIVNLQAFPMRGAFASGIPDLKEFPFDIWQRYVARHVRNPQLDWQSYAYRGGHEELRQTIADYIRIARGIRCDAAQVLITHGTQHGLQLAADLLADPGERVWMEDPGYMGARCAFDAAGLMVINQAVDAEGLAPPAAWQQPPRLIYTTPSHQYPTGVVMTAARRRHLLALAAQHQAWVLEDDYDSEFRYEGTPLAALHALAPNQVIYLGTFSKTFFPALAIGYMVLPEQLMDAFRAAQVRHQREPSYVIQKALADFIRDGHAGAHIRKMRREYHARRDTLVELLQTELGEQIHLDGLDTGLHLLAYLPARISDRIIAAEAYQRGIMTRALSDLCIDVTTARAPALLLGFGDANQQDIVRAGKILCQVIHEALDQ